MQNLPAAFDDTGSIREIIEAAPTGVVMIDAKGSIVLVNQELERMFGHARSALIGRPIEVLIPERYQHGHVHLRNSYLAKPERRPMGAGRELYARRADGSEFPVEIGLKGILGPEGTLAVASVVDVTARHEAELTARNIIAAAPYGLLIVDAHGTIVLANPQLTRIFGYTVQELIGMPVERLVPERYRAAHAGQRAGYARAPSLRAMGANRDLTGVHKDGTEFPLEIGLSPVPWQGGTGSLAAVIDISVRKRLELELREANAHLEEFTYVASHDLKSPLRGINDLVEWVSEDLKESCSPEIRRNLERIQARVSRMERIIEDLLSYARARNATVELTLVDPRELVNAMHARCLDRALDRGAELGLQPQARRGRHRGRGPVRAPAGARLSVRARLRHRLSHVARSSRSLVRQALHHASSAPQPPTERPSLARRASAFARSDRDQSRVA